MKFAVVITERAWAEIEEAYDWLAARAPEAAHKWKLGLLEAAARLETLPRATSIAPESDYFGREIRQFLYGKRHNKYRVLFEVRGAKVVVLHIRHSARRDLNEE